MIKLLLAHSVLTVAIGSVILATLERGTLCKDSALINHARMLILLGCVYFTILVSLYGCTRCSSGAVLAGVPQYAPVSPTFLNVLGLVFGISTLALYLLIITGINNCTNVAKSTISRSTMVTAIFGLLPSFAVVLRALFPTYQWFARKLSSMPAK
jgi:hypothetical protein